MTFSESRPAPGEQLLEDARRTLNPFTDDNMRARFMAELLSAAIATANSCLCGTSLEMARAYIAVYDEMRPGGQPQAIEGRSVG